MFTLDQFIEELESSLTMADTDSLQPETVFRELDWWDSLAMVGVLAVFDSYFGQQIQPADIGNCQTVEDLFKYGVSLKS